MQFPYTVFFVRSVLNFRTQCSDSNPNAIQFQNIQVSQATILYYDSAQLKASDLTLAQAYSLLVVGGYRSLQLQHRPT